MNKKCPDCGEIKKNSEFRTIRSKNRPQRLYTKCIKCERIYDKKRALKPKHRFSKYKRNAIKDKRDFKITLTEFTDVTDKSCFYCGGYSSACIYDALFCGMDRIDPATGYILDNVDPCCDICNYMKQSLTKEKFLNKIKDIYDNRLTGK